MTGTTISRKLFQQLIFGDNALSEEALEIKFEQQDESRKDEGGIKRSSAYVLVFESIVRTVIEHEHGLLCDSEIDVLEKFSKLSYNTRYCLVRFVLRKANHWHPISALQSYVREVGEEGLGTSIEDLCQPVAAIIKEESGEPYVKTEPMDVSIKSVPQTKVIDLTLDSEDGEGDIKLEETNEDVKPSTSLLTPKTFVDYFQAKPSTSKVPPSDPIQAFLQTTEAPLDLSFFCENENVMTLNEILWRLTKDQLADLVKRTKCKPKGKSPNKSEIIEALHNHASTQSVLPYNTAPSRKMKGKAKDDGLVQKSLPQFFSITNAPTNQEQRLKEMALKILGKCVRVNFDFYRLVRRLHIIYYRETEHPTALLLPSLLTTFKKRNYTDYDTTRSTDIWASREELLGYEKALELEQMMDEALNPPPEKNKRKATKTPGRAREQFMTPMDRKTFVTPLETPGSIINMRQSQTPDVKQDEALPALEQLAEDQLDEEVLEIKKEERVKGLFESWLYPSWQEQVCRRRAQEASMEKSLGLERFETGYVYTRMVYKASKVFGTLKEYDTELRTIESLLSQKFWSRGKRGQYYERRAIILGHLSRLAATSEAKLEHQWQCIEGLKEALMDHHTGLVYRPGFVKRLSTLEKRLKVPLEERTQCDGKLREAQTVELKAYKYAPLTVDAFGRPINEKENAPNPGLHAYMTVSNNDGLEIIKSEQPEITKTKTGKSRWKGRDGVIVNVETRALEYYEDQGYKGFHSETRILRTIFGLLFWDIIFMNIPGAFETAYQSGPLDMFEDSFYDARRDQIDTRLKEIKAGHAREILERHDNMYREKKTWCLCVSWDLCDKEELIEVIDCINGNSLADICQLFCEDYKGRSSGGPDLFVWKPAERSCKFVEVKGPGDFARENQKLWFDGLLQGGVDVEICKVLDENYQHPPSTSRKRKVKAPRIPQQKKLAQDETISDEEDYDQLDPTPDEGYAQPDMSPSAKRRRISNE